MARMRISAGHHGLAAIRAVLETARLFLPALIPSWRFFDTIAPSPRIECALLSTAQDNPDNWQEFRPRPAHLPVSAMMKRLFSNPRWNETLYLVSCAERLIQNGAEHSSREIVRRIKAELQRDTIHGPAAPWLRFRLVFVSRQGEELRKDVTFISPAYHYFPDAVHEP